MSRATQPSPTRPRSRRARSTPEIVIHDSDEEEYRPLKRRRVSASQNGKISNAKALPLFLPGSDSDGDDDLPEVSQLLSQPAQPRTTLNGNGRAASLAKKRPKDKRESGSKPRSSPSKARSSQVIEIMDSEDEQEQQHSARVQLRAKAKGKSRAQAPQVDSSEILVIDDDTPPPPPTRPKARLRTPVPDNAEILSIVDSDEEVPPSGSRSATVPPATDVELEAPEMDDSPPSFEESSSRSSPAPEASSSSADALVISAREISPTRSLTVDDPRPSSPTFHEEQESLLQEQLTMPKTASPVSSDPEIATPAKSPEDIEQTPSKPASVVQEDVIMTNEVFKGRLPSPMDVVPEPMLLPQSSLETRSATATSVSRSPTPSMINSPAVPTSYQEGTVEMEDTRSEAPPNIPNPGNDAPSSLARDISLELNPSEPSRSTPPSEALNSSADEPIAVPLGSIQSFSLEPNPPEPSTPPSEALTSSAEEPIAVPLESIQSFNFNPPELENQSRIDAGREFDDAMAELTRIELGITSKAEPGLGGDAAVAMLEPSQADDQSRIDAAREFDAAMDELKREMAEGGDGDSPRKELQHAGQESISVFTPCELSPPTISPAHPVFRTMSVETINKQEHPLAEDKTYDMVIDLPNEVMARDLTVTAGMSGRSSPMTTAQSLPHMIPHGQNDDTMAIDVPQQPPDASAVLSNSDSGSPSTQSSTFETPPPQTPVDEPQAVYSIKPWDGRSRPVNYGGGGISSHFRWAFNLVRKSTGSSKSAKLGSGIGPAIPAATEAKQPEGTA